MIHKAYKFRIYPTQEQQELLSKHFGCSRFVYNHFLNVQKNHYLTNKDNKENDRIHLYKSKFDNMKELTQLKKELTWLREVNAQSLQVTLTNLDTAYKQFFLKNSSFPKFKNRYSKQSFKVTQAVSINNKRLYIRKFKQGIKLTQHREFDGRIVNATVSKNPANQYFVSIVCEVEQVTLPKLSNAIGIDLGIKDFAVTSNKDVYSNPKILYQYENQLKYLNRQLSKKKLKSKNRNKARLKVAKLHNKIANIRQDFLHKLSSKIVNENQVIALEDLNVKGMMKNHNLAKAISNCSWAIFVGMLQYKSDWYGRETIKIDRWFPSSKTCTYCGYINQSLKLHQRTWVCKSCNSTIDRDYNAAINILKQGLNLIDLTAVGTIVESLRSCPVTIGSCETGNSNLE